MKIIFKLLCKTVWGQEVYLQLPFEDEGVFNSSQSLIKMEYTENFIWTKEISVPDGENLQFDYKYIIKDENGHEIKEGINKRNFSLDGRYGFCHSENFTVVIKDNWIKQNDPSSLFYTSFFKEVFIGNKKIERKTAQEIRPGSKRLIKFNIYSPLTAPENKIAITGNIDELGYWDPYSSKEMTEEEHGIWSIEITTNNDIRIEYKYIIKNNSNNDVIWEEGDNRHIYITAGDLIVINDNIFRYRRQWKGAGVCIPVFSIRTEKGLGTGEFLDLKTLADWASIAGFKIIQILPVNDTTRQYSWMDAYPYSCISAFALHPLYLNIDVIGYMPEDLRQEYVKRREVLNTYPHLEYEMVMAAKMYFSKKLFDLDNMKFLESEDFKCFFQENAFWLKPYALFCVLRDEYKTGDFKTWGKYSKINETDMERLVSMESEYYRDICFYYFLQYHLYKQLIEASRYLKSKGIGLKGDIPIGMHPESHELWFNPHLFHANKSAGAPPDAFSEHGQNWGFPTYNWERMAEDNYAWWRKRLKNMSQYFQLVRLDHVLGFFRIWEIPKGMYSGMMGRFNPATPITEEELKKEGFDDIDRLSEPYITSSIIDEIFGEHGDFVKENFLESIDIDRYKLKSNLLNQEKIDTFLNSWNEKSLPVDKNLLREGLFKLISNIILLKDEKNGFHFRFNMMQTLSFKSLEKWQQDKLIMMYNNYFFQRQDTLWRDTAMKRLPILKEASNMLICGEDLGLIPACVQPVMEELCILGLRIQRMPREAGKEFGDLNSYPYLTVCMTSTHDMPTLRGWWNEDREKVTLFYKHVLNYNEDPPEELTTEIAKEIIIKHLKSPSILAIFPIQDLLAMSNDLRWKGSPKDEQINNPADPYHRWKYRMHITVEELMKHTTFTNMLKDMITESSRLIPQI